MTQDEIIRMAVECQLLNASNREGLYAQAIERFAALVAAHEREACAKVCEDLYKHLNYDDDCRKLWPHTKMMNDQYAEAIRSRNEK